jgi:hypothetical protein
MAIAPKKVTKPKAASKPKAVAKPKPRAAGLKKDGTALPSKMNEMKALKQKATGNTKGAFGLPDNVGEQKAMNKLSKIGKSMGIGDYQDVSRYLSYADENARKAKAQLTKKRVSGTRASDKMYNTSKKTVTKKKSK